MSKRLGYYLSEQLTLKISLAGSDPKIWRRVEVHSGLTLHEFHYVIQSVYEWTDSHLYQFMVPPDGKLTQKAMSEARRYHLLPSNDFFDESKDFAADEQIVGRIFTPQCKQVVYEYDFGDSWQHIIKLEKRVPGGDPDSLPQCLAGENASPLDDLGGIYGYYNWLDALSDPSQDSHEDAVEWLGKDFDSTRFDLDLVNKRLKAAFKPVQKRPKKPRKKPK